MDAESFQKKKDFQAFVKAWPKLLEAVYSSQFEVFDCLLYFIAKDSIWAARSKSSAVSPPDEWVESVKVTFRH